MNLANVMVELGNRLDTITDLNVFSFPRDDVTPPAAMVLWPSDLTYDATYGRGTDRMTGQVVVVVGPVSEETTRDKLAAYCDGSGVRSVKQVLETGTYTSFGAVRVMSVEFVGWTIAGVGYAGALFDLDIEGDGA